MQLQELKKMYGTCRASKDNYDQLLQQREDVYGRIIETKEGAELYEHRERLKSIDHQIDKLEDYHDETLKKIKELLIAEIQQIYPESKDSYNQLCQQLADIRKEHACCRALFERLHAFNDALDEGSATKKSRGFWGILFGRNSKVLLARSIRKAAIEAERVHKYVDDEAIKQFLDVFLEEANRPWHNDLYRERFYELHHEFCQLMKKLEKKNIQSSHNTIETEHSIEAWIEKYCEI